MSYAAGEALILTRVQAVSGFTTANTSRGKWGVLNQGRSRQYAILKPGPFTRQPGKLSSTTWSTVIQVWYRYKDDGESLTGLEAVVDSLITAFDRYPHLGNEAVVTDSNLRRGSEVQEMWTRGGGPAWLKQDLYLEWTEQSITSFAE